MSRVRARHVGAGVLLGAGLLLLIMFAASKMSEGGGWLPTLGMGGLLLLHMAVMMTVCMLACVVPARRARRIEPTEVLAADG